MPYAVPTLCFYPGCRRLNCKRHDRRRLYDRSRGGSTARGYGIIHQRRRLQVLAEEPFCKICQREGRVTRSTLPDHIIPLGRGGTGARSNLQGSCVSCNNRKGDKIKGDLGWCKSFAP